VTYQAIWKDGQVLKEGIRECDSRYDLIKPVLESYRRSFTVLDLGASEGYFCRRIQDEYPKATCIAVEPNGQIFGTIHLKHRLTAESLENLARCEHFDVVLCFNLLHHFKNYARVLAAVRELGDILIVETPPPTDHGACGQDVVRPLYELLTLKYSRILGWTPSHTADVKRPMIMYETPKSSITKSYWDVPKSIPLGGIEIHSTQFSKTVTFKRKQETREWTSGINLRTFQRLGGQRALEVAEMIKNAPVGRLHGDVSVWNYILNRDGVHLIDRGDATRMNHKTDEQGKDIVVREIRGLGPTS